MLKKKLHTALSIILCYCTICTAKGQTINVTEANITAQSDVTALDQYVATILATGQINAKANANFVNSFGFPALDIGTLKIKGNKIGLISIGGSAEITLALTDRAIYSGLGLAGAVTVDYRIPTAGFTWQAGNYTNTLIYSVNGNVPLTIAVPAYITATTSAPASIPLAVNNLSFFRATAGISSANINIGYNTTVPTIINLKAKSASTFTFTPGFTSSLTFTPVNSSLVSAALTSPVGSTISVTTVDQAITTAAGLPVVATNARPTLTSVFSITGANLKANFVNAGVYKLPITYTIANTTGFQVPASSKTMDSSIDLTVSTIMDINLPTNTVSLNFDNQSNYTAGVTSTVANQVSLSSTAPYNVTVRASTAAFVNTTDASSIIPLNVMTIEGMTGQTGITPIVLSTTAQPIITAGNPVLDRSVNLQYRIPAAQVVSSILGKSQGNYSATIVFTIVAP